MEGRTAVRPDFLQCGYVRVRIRELQWRGEQLSALTVERARKFTVRCVASMEGRTAVRPDPARRLYPYPHLRGFNGGANSCPP